MVADLNLLGSVGDLYCFSNTFSMLLYVAPICCPSCFFFNFLNNHIHLNEGKDPLSEYFVKILKKKRKYSCLLATITFKKNIWALSIAMAIFRGNERDLTQY